MGMTTDLWMLAASALLLWVLIMVPSGPKLMARGGLAWALGNRGDEPDRAPWVERAERAYANLMENLVIFAPLVLVAHVSGRASDLSAAGAVVFFGARVAHAVVYLLGLKGVRTLAWLVGVVGTFMVAAAIVVA